MSRASRARRIAAAAAFGGGGLTALGALGVGLVTAEAKMARRWIGQPFGAQGPPADGVYGSGPGEPIELAILGDSSAAGLGADSPEQTPGAIIAAALAAVSGRSVRLTTVAVVGAESAGLTAQVDELLEKVPHPDLAVAMVGGNDVTHRVKPTTAVRALAQAVTQLREAGCEVVVGTCPDLGTIQPIAQPLRTIARRLSREMAAAQTIAVVESGGRSVSLGDVLGPEFAAAPRELFSQDRFHPSAAGYARCASVLLPSVCAAAGYWPDGGMERAPERRRGEGVAPVSRAAVAAADKPGTEVAATKVGGDERSHAGRWAMLLTRRREPLPRLGERLPAPLPRQAGDSAPPSGAGPDGGGADGAREEGARVDGARVDGSASDGARVEGARVDGARVDGARVDGARVDGASKDRAGVSDVAAVDPPATKGVGGDGDAT